MLLFFSVILSCLRNKADVIAGNLMYIFLYLQSRLFEMSVLINFCVFARIGLLAFHLALVNNPQDAFVVLAFASILYHGEWKEGIRFARENAEVQVNFVPELSKSFSSKSVEELAREVSQLATLAQGSLNVLSEEDSLLELMSRYPISPCPALVSKPNKYMK